MIDWHRLFGLTMTDYFTDSGYEVELEKDLSIKKQRLDVLIIERESESQISEPPDGLENLARHNLLTYKSFQEPLDAWTLDELLGHSVNYRKLRSSSLEKLLPVEDFQLYAVSTRHPEKLESEFSLELIKQGVYEVRWGSRRIRLIVLSEVPKVERNAPWLLFSGIAENVQYGSSHYQWREKNLSSVINKLFGFYQVEGTAMPYTVEDFTREMKEELLAELAPEERKQLEGQPLIKIMNRMRLKALFRGELTPEMRFSKQWVKDITMQDIWKALAWEEDLFEDLPVEELVKRLPPEERLKGLPPEERLKGLPPEERLKGLPPEERLKGLTREEIEAYLKKLSTSN
ncbi:MAG: hypothetical protein ACREOI_21235 [bacterium]